MSWGQALGAVSSGVGSYLSGKANKKAAKKYMQQLQNALKLYQAGSTDALGNSLSANSNGQFSYNLGLSGQNAAKAANLAYSNLGQTKNKTSDEIFRDNLSTTNLADNLTAQQNLAAAMKQGLRTGSNLNTILNNAQSASARNLRNNYLQAAQAAKNSDLYNQQRLANMASYTTQAAQPLNNITNNLQNMVNSLNKTEMQQANQIAGASANPYLYGQGTADIFNSIGNSLSRGSGDSIEQYFNNNTTTTTTNNNTTQLTEDQIQQLLYLLECLQNGCY